MIQRCLLLAALLALPVVALAGDAPPAAPRLYHVNSGGMVYHRAGCDLLDRNAKALPEAEAKALAVTHRYCGECEARETGTWEKGPTNPPLDTLPAEQAARYRVALDYEAQYRMASSGDQCALAGFVKAAYLATRDQPLYQKWVKVEHEACASAGVAR